MRSIFLGPLAVIALVGVVQSGNGDLPLIEAVKQRDAAAVRSLLKRGAAADARQPDGTTALLWAAEVDSVEAARALLQGGARVDAPNDYGITPLWVASLNGSAPMIDLLLDAGANPRATLPTGETPLMAVARSGRVDVVKRLLAGATVGDVNTRDRVAGQTALMWALAERHLDVVRVLIESGADVRSGSASGFTPLMFAARHGDLDAVKLLLSKGADLNGAAKDGLTTLHVAIVRGHAELAEYLLEVGANPNATGPGYTPLHWAVFTSETFMSKDYQVESGEWAALAGLPTRESKMRMVRLLIAKGADVNARLTGRRAPVFGHTYNASLRGGGDLKGATPFMLVSMVADTEMMRLLVASGADPLLTSDGRTTGLMLASGLSTEPWETLIPLEHRLAAAKLSVELGQDIRAANAQGNTALHATAYLGADPVAEFLLDRGATINARNKRNETPLQIARGYSLHLTLAVHESTAELLQRRGGVADEGVAGE